MVRVSRRCLEQKGGSNASGMAGKHPRKRKPAEIINLLIHGAAIPLAAFGDVGTPLCGQSIVDARRGGQEPMAKS
jgi:hypothetical protein